VAATAVCLGLLAAGAGAAWALPEPAFPEPSGPYPVGTTVAEWTDPARPEPATRAPGDRRTVVAQLWYPAREPPGDTERAQYLGPTQGEARTVAAGLAGYLGLPAFLLDGAARARTAAIPGAAVAEGDERFPVMVFSPGLGGVRTQNTAWAEELASRGYVVAALDHPYDSAAVVLDDGRTIPTRLRATTTRATTTARRPAGPRSGPPTSASPSPSFAASTAASSPARCGAASTPATPPPPGTPWAARPPSWRSARTPASTPSSTSTASPATPRPGPSASRRWPSPPASTRAAGGRPSVTPLAWPGCLT
jgi:hypothetical protein